VTTTGSLGKTEVLVAALKRVAVALRMIGKPTPTPAALLRKAQEARKTEAAQRPGPGRTGSKDMQVKASQRHTVPMAPRAESGACRRPPRSVKPSATDNAPGCMPAAKPPHQGWVARFRPK
jgi:hypothetical protein